MARALSIDEAYYSRILKTTTCWFWIGRIDGFGYGTFTIAGKQRIAHRFSYELAKGPIPNGLTLDHKCRVPHCINPDHLEPCTSDENVRRRNIARANGGLRPIIRPSVPSVRTLDEAFHSQLFKTTTCWLWAGQSDLNGYGRLCFKGKHHLAHIFSWELINGLVPDGLVLDHLCRVPKCVNPDHLEPVTFHENILRGKEATKTHCIRGHEFTAANTVPRSNGRRLCRECQRIRGEARARRNGVVPNGERTKTKDPNYRREYDRRRYLANREEIKQRTTEYRKAHMPETRALMAKYRATHREELRKYFADYRKRTHS